MVTSVNTPFMKDLIFKNISAILHNRLIINRMTAEEFRHSMLFRNNRSLLLNNRALLENNQSLFYNTLAVFLNTPKVFSFTPKVIDMMSREMMCTFWLLWWQRFLR